jgi:hypothetical protein
VTSLGAEPLILPDVAADDIRQMRPPGRV